jgi:putative salt-induced outer membrane protein YdiY
MLLVLPVLFVSLLGAEMLEDVAVAVTEAQPASSSAGAQPSSAAPATALLAAVEDEADAEPEEEKNPGWEGAVTFIASLSDGNTKIKNGSATADGVLARGQSRTTLSLLWNYAEDNGAISQRVANGTGQYDRFFTAKTYGLVQASAGTDDIALVDLRTTAGVGAGRQVLDNEAWQLGLEIGLSHFNEKLATNVDTDYLAVRGAYNWEYGVEKWSLGQTAEVFPNVDDASDVYARVDTRAKLQLSESMFAQLQWVFLRDNTPALGNVKNDNLYLLTFGWSF